MSLSNRPKPKSDLPPIPAGMHHAILYSVVDLGTQYSKFYDKSSYKVAFTWEFPMVRGEFEKDGEKKDLPRALSKTYTYSMHEKASLYKHLKSWWGRELTGEEVVGFDLGDLAGHNATLQIMHTSKDDRIYANIESVLPLMPNMSELAPENALVVYDRHKHGTNIPDGVPKWLREKIEDSPEYKNLAGKQERVSQDPVDEPDLDDDIPF